MARWTSRAQWIVVVVVASVWGLTAPAQADEHRIHDPRGDAGGGLDVLSVHAANRAHAVTAHFQFARLTTGRLVFYLVPHGSGIEDGVTVVSRYLARGRRVDTRVLGLRPRCLGLQMRWRPRTATADLVLPAECIDDGDYGGLRFGVLTEALDGGDSDTAPQGRQLDSLHFTPGIGRG